MVLLSFLAHIERFYMVVYFVEDFGEISWATQTAILNGMLVRLNYIIKSLDLWVKDITVQSKAVRSLRPMTWESSPVPIATEFLVAIVVLKDSTNAFDGFLILIVFWIKIVKRRGIFRKTIRAGEINGDRQIDFTSTNDIFQECCWTFNLQMIELKSSSVLHFGHRDVIGLI